MMSVHNSDPNTIIKCGSTAMGIAFLLGLILSVPAVGAPRTWLQVAPNPNYVPKGGLTLEVAGKAYSITQTNGGGVTSFISETPVLATLRKSSDCTIVIRLTLQPGTSTAIDLNADGSPRVTDYTESGLDAGPALQSDPDACSQMPPTSTAAVDPATSDGQDSISILWLIFSASLAAAFGMIVPRRFRARSRER